MLILDEASFTSTRELFALINVIQKLDIRLVMLGDYAQLNSVEAGRIFYLLLGSSMQSYALTENVRFDSLKALQTMQFIYKGQIGDALQNLGGSLVEIEIEKNALNILQSLIWKNLEEKAML
jgi:ATP-dependent exoDNAse (exonuclease V) alpha subunit